KRRLGEFYTEAPGVGDASVSREYAAAMGGAVRQLSQRLRATDGRLVDVNITFARIDAPQGAVVQAILRDLTEHRAIERQRVQEQRGDAAYLEHAGVQLLLNARQAMRGEPGDRLGLTAAVEVVRAPDKRWAGARPGRYVRFSVSDTGQGMDAATVERVFEPFFTTKPLHEATGLGLATVYRAVKAHGGAIGIESAPGRGTTVHLLIPVALRAAATAP